MIPPGRIDCHVHFYPPAFADMLLSSEGPPGPRPPSGPGPGRAPLGSFVLAPKPEWRDLAALGQVMDETGVGLGVIIPPASLIERLRPSGAGATEQYNQSMSDELAKAEGRFWAARSEERRVGKECRL